MKYLLLLAALPLVAQTRVMFSPESLKSNVLGINQIGEWDLSAVNMSPNPTTKSLTEMLMYAPALHRLPPARTAQVLSVDVANSKAQRLIRVLSYVDIVAPAIFPGIVAINATGIASLALGTAVVHHFTDTLKARQPDQNAYTVDGCPDTITLAPYGTAGYAVTCSVFSSLVHNAATIGPVDIPAVPGPLKAEAAAPITAQLDESDRASGEFVALVAMQVMR